MKNKGNRCGEFVSTFFLRVVAAVMGCFFSCLRVKDSPSSSPPSSIPTSTEAGVRKRIRLSSLVISESVKEDDFDVKGIEDEAKFLKAWGTLPETPTEIREMSREREGQLIGSSDIEESKFRSCLVTPTDELNLEYEPSQPLSPATKCGDLAEGTVSLRYEEGNNGEQSAVSSKFLADQSYKSASAVQGKKSVRFYCDTGTPSVQNLSPEMDTHTSKDLGVDSICNMLRPDPYPTPIRLHAEMQTPGTVFSAYQDVISNGKKARIRSQFVKSVLNPIDNLYQWQRMKPNVSEFSKLSIELEESLEEAEENVPCIQTHDDHPILGMVAADWDEDEAFSVSPKLWDGNGIPNSTSKYKEDQKVSWHETPFVERLEKALSKDTMIPQRKHSSGRRSRSGMSELEESDTALLVLQSSSNIKSIASC